MLEVFKVFASGTLADEVCVLDDVSGKRIEWLAEDEWRIQLAFAGIPFKSARRL